MTSITPLPSLDFELPPELSAREPAEARGEGLGRDSVRLMVSRLADDFVVHAHFADLPTFLAPGDVVVVNTSATMNAALEGWRERGPSGAPERVALHLSSPHPSGETNRWVIELRRLTARGHAPLLDAAAGESVGLPGGGRAVLVEPFLARPDRFVSSRSAQRPAVPPNGSVRLWVAELSLPSDVRDVAELAARYGAPIRYKYVHDRWPLAAYQTIFADTSAPEPGSAEMASAGRPFTRATVRQLRDRGVLVAPLVLHTGVASLELHEPPYPERYRVPAATAAAVNAARHAGRRVVAVGTTVVRALESVAAPDGRVRAGAGWTDLVITPERGIRAIDALLTGFHEPRSSHLAMLEALAGRRHLEVAYEAALAERYLWHEFGDVHLIMR